MRMHRYPLLVLVLILSFQCLGQRNHAEIPIAYRIVAAHQNVPAPVLYAIALAESGKSDHDGLKPWPWSLNVDGDSVYCRTRQQCVMRAHNAIQRQQSVDVGLMQINWYWHQHRFVNLAMAWDPMTNLQVGAVILREQYEKTEDWWQAVGHYHSPSNAQRAARYRARVRQHWLRL